MHLVRYEEARNALRFCAEVDEAKDILDKVSALQAYAKQQQDTEMETWIAEMKIRARRRIGELSSGLEKAQGEGGGPNNARPSTGKNKINTLKAAGLTTSVANRCEKIAAIPEETFEAVINEAKEKHKPVTYADIEKKVSANNKKPVTTKKQSTKKRPRNEKKRLIAALAEIEEATSKTASVILKSMTQKERADLDAVFSSALGFLLQLQDAINENI